MPKLTFPISMTLEDLCNQFPDEVAEAYGYNGTHPSMMTELLLKLTKED